MRIRPGFLTALLVACIVAASCQSAPNPSHTVPGSGGPASGGPAVSAPAASPTDALPVAPPTSEELIAAALASGAITTEQSLLYRSLALFDAPTLPPQFHSSVPDLEAAGSLLRDIDTQESKLSADTLKQLAPYRARPNDPISIYNSPPAQAGVNAVALADIVPTWKSRPAAGGKALVWVKDSAAAEADLDKYAAMVSQVWGAYPDIFTYPLPDKPKLPSAAINPDSAIDIYFINVGEIDPRRAACVANPSDPECVLAPKTYGYAVRVLPYPGHTSSASLVIDSGRTDDDLIDTIAHELAHASQFAYDTNESSWLMESTATWVAFKVDKKLGKEPAYQYKWLPQLFNGFDQPLTRLANGNAYASWLYFLFASMESGDGVVTDIWKAAAAEGEQGYKAVDQVFPFANHYADFAVRDWNADPVKPRYKAADGTFPPQYQPRIANAVKTLEGDKVAELDAHLPPLASAYFQYDFPDAVRDVTLDNTLAGDPAAHVWAIKKVGGEWQPPEDWTTLATKKLCRDIPTDDVSTLVLVVSNAGTTDDLTVPEPPTLTAGTKGCSGWQGTMKMTVTWKTGASSYGTATSSFSGLWVIDDDLTSSQCDPSSTCTTLLRPTGTVNWTWDAHAATRPPCSQTTSGTQPAGQERVPLSPGQLLHMRPVDSGHIQYWGTGWFDPGVTLKCGNFEVGGLPGSYFELASEANGTYPVGADGGTCNNRIWQIETKADTMSGSCISYKYWSGTETYEWNLTRVGPTPGS
jgi:hypothetical protein